MKRLENLNHKGEPLHAIYWTETEHINGVNSTTVQAELEIFQLRNIYV